MVCAGFEPERAYDQRIAAWLRRANGLGSDLGAMDTGAFLLARAGLLDGHRATTHWESLDSFRERFPKVEVESGLFVIDRHRFTCAGGTAALDMMLHLIALRHGGRLVAAVSEQFIHAHIRDPQDRRRHMVSITTDGKRQFARLRTAVNRIEDAFLEPLDEPTRKALHDTLLEVACCHDQRFKREP